MVGSNLEIWSLWFHTPGNLVANLGQAHSWEYPSNSILPPYNAMYENKEITNYDGTQFLPSYITSLASYRDGKYKIPK